ncbi:MAG TPA: C-GCAxxG-C-C family protein [Lachnospiraceae bacterium]|nr:C-GCAxxG-C-C family protein [Lachnospiraceae bacterium]
MSCLEKRFKEKYGTVICSEIIGAKFPEDMQRIKDENLTKGCAALTAYACEILDELL